MSNGRTRKTVEAPVVQQPEPEPEQTPQNGEGRNQPAQIVRYRNIRVAIWRNEASDGAIYFTMTLSRLYKDGDGWRSSASLGRDDALLAMKALNDAHTWITMETQNSEIPF